MECEELIENGRPYIAATRKSRNIRRQLPDCGARHLRLDVAAAVPAAPFRTQMHLSVVSHHSPDAAKATCHDLPVGNPFINNMDEITYWIYTKRAPCLLNYDNVVARQSEEAQCSKTKPISIHSAKEVPTPKKKKKRKLSMLDDDSMSAERLQNVYFDVSHKQHQMTVESSSKSNSLDSDVDFNIKNSSVRGKCKKIKLQKSSRTTLHKKNKIVTSTPKVTANLRRSLRRAQQSNNNNNSHLNSSFEIFNASAMNGNIKCINADQVCGGDKNNSLGVQAGGDQNGDSKTTPIANNKRNETVHNGQFEDLSDVSGFTANYIRSTKMTKTPRKLRCKSNRNLMKGRQSGQKDTTTMVCLNKGLNTGLPKSAAANCSTDSSQNVINLVTKRSNGKSTRVNKSTSLLKFMDTKPNKSLNKDDSKPKSKANMNVSFQSNSTSRYPKRHKKYSPIEETTTNNNNNTNHCSEKKQNISKNSSDFNNSDKKENPEDILISRTRSGRNLGLTLRQPENSVLVLSNSTEQVSSMASVNVASPARETGKSKKKRQTLKNSNAKKSLNKTSSFRKDSLREKSGFAACFSDSDDDNEPLKQRKFFRA